MSRKSISKRLRFAVLERDGFRCRYCGADPADGAKLHIDHRLPVSKGGQNDFDNLVTACADCNLGKHAFLPTLQIACQREMALAATIFQRTCERYGSQVPLWAAFTTILNFCLAEPEPEPLLKIALSASSWEEARAEMYRFAGYQDDDESGAIH